MRRRLAVLSLLIVASGAGALGAPGAADAAPPPATSGKTYVALGDSYAAGFGLPLPSTPTGEPVPGCEQTTGDYPHILAGQLGLKLTDVACSGATTVDFTHPQDVNGPQPPAQLDIFKTVQPDLVTITIGGNDLGFTSIATACAASAPSGALARVYGSGGANLFKYPSCKDYFDAPTADGGGKAANPYDSLPGVVAKVKAAVAAVRQAAPKAKVAVIAYPAIAPDVANTPTGGCYTSLAQQPGQNVLPSALPFTDVDIPYLQVLQQDLDAGIGKATQQLGASYADIYPSSLSHSACQPENTRWVEPLTPDDGGTNVLHPNLAGANAMAAALNPVVQRLLAAPVTAAPSTGSSSATGTSTNGSSSPAGGAAAGTSSAAGSAPLAATGPAVPLGWTVLLGVLLVATGAALLHRVSVAGRRRHL